MLLPSAKKLRGKGLSKMEDEREVNSDTGGLLTSIDPVCRMSVDVATAAAQRSYGGVDYWFCSPSCADTFDADPVLYAIREKTSGDSTN